MDGDIGVVENTLRAAIIEELSNKTETYSLKNTYNLNHNDIEPDLENLYEELLIPCESPFMVRPVLDESGDIEDFAEYILDAENMATASNSMSLNRLPDSYAANSTRGSASNIPFFPGGFEEDLENLLSSMENEAGTEELQYLDGGELLHIPPEWDQGMVIPKNPEKQDVVISDTLSRLEDLDIFELMDMVGDVHTTKINDNLKSESEKKIREEVKIEVLDQELDDQESSQEIDNLPVLDIKLDGFQEKRSTHEFIKVMNATSDLPAFRDIENRMAKNYPFKLDPFQQASVISMEEGNSLFVAAHTSAGKTVVAEYAIALCKAHKTRAIYTSPIKALSNQKYRDFKLCFDDVGLVTGDIQLNPEAFCLIMTTEILRSMLYNGSETVRDLEWVIFDEVHYINNVERGHVWEEVLIMLPAHVKIVMLSATVPNYEEFADWVGRIKKRQITVVSTLKRPVPLEHWIYTGSLGKGKTDIFKLIDHDGAWNNAAYKAAVVSKETMRKPLMSDQNNQGGTVGNRGGGGYGNRGGGGGGGYGNRGGGGGGGYGNRGGGGGGGYGNRGGGGGGGYGNRGGGGGGGYKRGNNDKNIYINLINFLKSKELLPMVVFVFSRKKCDDIAQLISSLDLTTNVEKGHIKHFFLDCINRLQGSDKELPQVLIMRELCIRGFAVHHSGILPILKEVVELLFQKGYVKILFATETFAMGVNMPARSVIFDTVEKHDGTSKRPLNPGEYIQMAGRAGRRGLDSTGTVIILAKEEKLHDSGYYQSIMMGKSLPLESKFRVTYSMLLNLLRVEHLHIEQMLQRSFAERTSLREQKKKQYDLKNAVEELKFKRELNCSLCADNLADYYKTISEYLSVRKDIWKEFIKTKQGSIVFQSGRILVLSNPDRKLDHQIAVLLKDSTSGDSKKYSVLVSCDENYAYNFVQPKPSENSSWTYECHRVRGICKYGLDGIGNNDLGRGCFKVIDDITLDDIVCVPKKHFKINANEIIEEAKLRSQVRFRSSEIPHSIVKILQQINSLANEWASTSFETIEPENEVSYVNLEYLELPTTVKFLRDNLLNPTIYTAKHCAELLDHIEIVLERVDLTSQISRLQFELSAGALLLSDEYKDRMKMLTTLGYVGKDNMVTFKGRVACEIHYQEILVAELLLENKLHDRTPAEVAALLSAFTCQYKNGDGVKFDTATPEGKMFEELKNDVLSVSKRLDLTSAQLKVQIVEVGDEIRFDLMPIVYDWALGKPFSEIMEKTQCQEGLIVRCIQRLSELCKDVRNAARIVGDQDLYEKMELASSAIKRDIVFAASLYTC